MPDGIQLPITSANAPRYRYYTVNIVTNKVIGEIPFEDVNYERSVKSPGAFDGKITITDQTNDLDLYNSTLPGKTALYVVRNDEAVWGGIIWGRTYDLVGRSLAISASEFTSYFSHRLVWKTYSHSFTAKLSKPTDESYVKVAIINKSLKAGLSLTDDAGNPTKVTVNFTDNNLRKYNGEYEVKGLSSTPPAPADPGVAAFYVDMATLPSTTGIYDGVGVTLKADTYDYLRDLVTSTLNDFIDIQFPNEVIEPGVKEAVTINSKRLDADSETYGVATLTTEEEHELTVGQRVTIQNVDPMLDGLHKVSEIPNKFTFKYILDNPVSAYDNLTKIKISDISSTPVGDTRDIVKYRQVDTALNQQIIEISRSNGETTLTFDGAHNFEKGQKIKLTIEPEDWMKFYIPKTTTRNGKKTTKKVLTNTFDYKKWNYIVLVNSVPTDETLTYLEPKYKSNDYNRATYTIAEKNAAKTYAEPAEPVPTLVLYPQESSGYSIGDSIYVDGVDQPGWPYSIYDGFQQIFDISIGESIPISSYSAALGNPNEDDVDDFMVVTYVCDKDPRLSAGDEFEVSNIDDYPSLNGRFQALVASYPLDVKWIVKVKANVEAIASHIEAATLRKNGAAWVAYKPNTSELRYSLKSEPDGVANMAKLSYNKSSKIVTITTEARHNFRIGDRVKIAFTKKGSPTDAQKIYGGTVTVTGVGDLDSFSYKLIKSEHSKPAPTTTIPVDTPVTAKGSVTAIKSSAIPSTALDIPVQAIRVKANPKAESVEPADFTVTVYSTDNDLKPNDYVSLAFTKPTALSDDNYSGLGTYGEPVKVTDAATNYFRYTVGGPAFTTDTSNVSEIKYYDTNTTAKTANTVALKVDVSSALSNITANVVSVNFSNKSTNQIIVTTDAPHGIVSKRKVTLSGFPEPGSTYRAPSNTATSNIINISYQGDTKTALIEFDSDHGLDEIDDIGARLRVGNAATSVTYPDETNFTSGLPLGSWFRTTLDPIEYSISSVTIRDGFIKYATQSPITNISVGDIVSAASFANTSYNLTGVVAAIETNPEKVGSRVLIKTSLSNASSVSTVAGKIVKKQYNLTPYTANVTAASSNGTLITYTAAGHKLAPGDSISVTGLANTSYNFYDLTVNTVPTADTFTVAKVVAAGSSATPTGSKVSGYIGGHYISEIVSPTAVAISVMDFQYSWEILEAGLTETNGTTYFVTEGKSVFDNSDYSKLNFTADAQAVTSNTITFIFPGVDDPGYSGIYTPTVGTVKAYAADYKNPNGGTPVVGDIFYLENMTKTTASVVVNKKTTSLTEDFTYLSNVDGHVVTQVDTISGDATKVWVRFKNPKDPSLGNKRPLKSGLTFSGTKPLFSRATPISGNAYLSQSSSGTGESRNSYTINKITRSISAGNTTATVYVANTHDINVGDYVMVDMFREDYDSFAAGSAPVEVTATTTNTVSYRLTSPSYVSQVSYSKNKFVTLYFDGGLNADHDYVVGDVITVATANTTINGVQNYGGANFTIISTSPTSVTYVKTGLTKNHSKSPFTSNARVAVSRYSATTVSQIYADGIMSKVPTIYKRPVVFRKTYGEYPANAEIGGITFSTMDYSNKSMPNSPIYGSDLQTVAEILDKYSNGLNGFEYRIDPGLTIDENGIKKFTRKFVLIPIYPRTLTDYLATLPDGKLARGQVATPAALGADKVIFEYPGNITNVSMAEKAETSATRIFVRSGDGKAGSGTEVAYSAAADTDLLQDNWPLLDKKESVTWPLTSSANGESSAATNTDEWGNHDDETDYHKSAVRFLRESKPPAGDFVIDVNGSVTPVIGSYNPGEWCSIIINDNFVKTRLNSVLEPRKDVIVRKIDAIKVAVPNNPAFPEKISLTLIPDWQVDAVGK